MTAQELITASYRLVGNHAPDAEKFEFGLQALNLVINNIFWSADDLLDIPTLETELPFNSSFWRACKYVLAIDLGLEYGWTIPQIVYELALDAKRFVAKQQVTPPEPSTFDEALLHTGNSFNITEG